jgi:hypothetical protein
MDSPAPATPSTVYYHRNRKANILFAGLLSLAAILIAVQRPSFWLAALVFIAVAALLTYFASAARLTISERGLRLVQPGLVLDTTWDNVAAIGRQRRSWWGGRPTEGLVLRRPALYIRGRLRADARFREQATFLPLSTFDLDWREGALGRRLRDRLPHLFAPAAAPTASG